MMTLAMTQEYGKALLADLHAEGARARLVRQARMVANAQKPDAPRSHALPGRFPKVPRFTLGKA